MYATAIKRTTTRRRASDGNAMGKGYVLDRGLARERTAGSKPGDCGMASIEQSTIGDTWRESEPWWPPDPEPPPGAPNIVVVVLDDVGFAQLGCYGSDIATPNIDRLASEGTRLANFHTTALCSPTRACVLTGRNHHAVGMGRVADLAMGYPGYRGRIGREHGMLAEVLAGAGYVPVAVGKWHLTPEDETHMAAPRNTWPVARGFQRWYGFHGGETHQFVPMLFQDNQWVPPPRADGYHLTTDLTDHAISYLGDVRSIYDASVPFFLYFATGACHSPHHAPKEWIDRYDGAFDRGWDSWREATFTRQLAAGLLPPGTELSPRPPWVPAWDELDAGDQRVAARFQECFAGFLSHADAEIGRVLSFVEHDLGELDDTLVVLLSDNGASAEGGKLGSLNDARVWNAIPAGRSELRARIDELGGPSAHNNYPWGWTMAGNTPFKRWKREVHEGGVADPCIFRWPARLGAGGSIRHQYAHAIDVLPTVLDLAGVRAPEAIDGVTQSPINGVSIAPWLTAAGGSETRTTQYFEMLGSRAIYHDGWKAVTFKPLGPMYDDGLDPDASFAEDRWELYHVADDLSECHDLAADEPERLEQLRELWWREARANKVLPLDNRPLAALLNPRPSRAAERSRYQYFPDVAPVPESVAVNVRNRSHAVTVDIVAGDDVDGVLVSQGSVLGGWVLYVRDRTLRYAHNLANKHVTLISSETVIGRGEHRLGFELTSPGDFTGRGLLFVDGVSVGEGDIPLFTPARFSITGAGLTCGYDVGPAVSPEYDAPFPFTGTIARVVIDVSGRPYRDVEADLAAILAEQ
ncbi:MAG: arylsulfatase [Actinobacteria bacterium]|nr:arylsulfatase [Actinomycetota bacterium]